MMHRWSPQTCEYYNRNPAHLVSDVDVVAVLIFTHDKDKHDSDHADYNRKAVVFPASTVSEVQDRVVYVASWSQNPQRDNDAKYPQNMKHEDNRFGQR